MREREEEKRQEMEHPTLPAKPPDNNAAGGRGKASAALVVLFLIAQSNTGKIYKSSCVVSHIKPDLNLVTESWCNESITNAFLKGTVA